MKTFAIIGVGRWGPNHVRNFNALKDCRVVAVADPQEYALARIRARYPDVDCYADFHMILDRPDVDAVVVATPTSLHAQVVREALQAGKHVLCEKPLTSESRDAWELVSLSEQKGLILMVGHVFHSIPASNTLCVRCDNMLGPLYYVTQSARILAISQRRQRSSIWPRTIFIFSSNIRRRPVSVSASGIVSASARRGFGFPDLAMTMGQWPMRMSVGWIRKKFAKLP